MGSAKRVVAIPGEDAAAEAFGATMSLLDGLSLDIDWTYPPVGAGAIQTHGEPFPAEAIAAIDGSDAALFGATSGASASALFYLRWGRVEQQRLALVTTSGCDLRSLSRRHLCSDTDSLGMRAERKSRLVITTRVREAARRRLPASTTPAG
jgi:hypothetical protein